MIVANDDEARNMETLLKNCKIYSFRMEFCGIRIKTINEPLMRMRHYL